MSDEDGQQLTMPEIEDLREKARQLEQVTSERDEALRMLEETQNRHRLALDLAGEIYFSHDLDGNIYDLNIRATQLLGYTREELLSLKTMDLDPEWNPENLAADLGDRPLGVPLVRFPHPRRKDGSTIPIEARLGLIDIDGKRMAVAFGNDISERTEAIAAIRDREKRFRQLAENVDTVFWIVDWVEQNVIYVSPAYERVYGRPLVKLYDDPIDWVEAVHPKDREEVMDAYLPGAISGYDLTFRVVHEGGEIHWLHARGFPIRDDHGRVYRMAGITEDVTEYKNAEQALKDGELRFRSLACMAPVGIFELDPEGSCLYVNERWCQMAGITAAEAKLGDWSSVIHPEDQERVNKEWRLAQERGEEYSGEFRFQTPNGEVTWMFAVSLAMHDENHQITGYLGTITDITELKAVEAKLRKSEERFQMLYEYSPAMYFTIDVDGTVQSVNQVGAEQLGYTVDELLGQQVLDVFHEDDREEVRKQITYCAEHPEDMFRWEFRKRKKDGTVIWVEEAARAVENSDGTRVILILCEDVTSRKTL